MQERRFCKKAQVRVSASGVITGYAAVFNLLSEDLGGFRELILPGAFSQCLLGNPDVRALFNHDSNLLLGRTVAGTLRLSEDRAGLYFECDLPDTQAGRDVRASIKRGDLRECSFGFTVNGQNWREEKGTDGKTQTIRELTEVDVFDVSPVTYAAYPQTSVSARAALFPEGEPLEVRRKISTPRKGWAAPPAVSRAVNPEPPAPEKTEYLKRFEACTTDAQRAQLIATKLGQPIPVRRISMVRATPYTSAEVRELRDFLLTGRHERRDLTTGGAAYGFVPETFNAHVFEAMKVYDEIFDDEVTTRLETDTGAACDLFGIDDTENAAYQVGEGSASSYNEVDPASLQKLTLADCPIWDTGVVACSLAFLQDQRADIPGLLARSFGIRLARGIGQSLISTLESSALLGATANGDPNGSGTTGANSIGYGDLIALKGSVNQAYRASSKVFWMMSDSTLTALDSLLDKQGHPIITPVYVNGRRILLGFPVAFSPSLPSISANAKPIYFGAFDRVIVRTVATGGKGADNQDNGRIARLWETPGFAESLLVGLKSWLRCNGGLLDVTDNGSLATADSPVKFLQNAA